MTRSLTKWLLIAGFAIIPARATVLFSDDFSADTAGLSKTSLNQWTLLNGSNVDIGNFGALCGPGPSQCVDTEGTGGNPVGDILSIPSFSLSTLATYDFHFTLNDSPDVNNSFKITIGTFSQTVVQPTTPDGTYDLVFTVASNQTAQIEIQSQGPADPQGNYLGHISLSDNQGAVPEPATVSLLGGGLLGLIGLGRKMRRS